LHRFDIFNIFSRELKIKKSTLDAFDFLHTHFKIIDQFYWVDIDVVFFLNYQDTKKNNKKIQKQKYLDIGTGSPKKKKKGTKVFLVAWIPSNLEEKDGCTTHFKKKILGEIS
jgi:hypothetical protein